MIGTTLSHYKIISELGRGGMGIVYKAEDTKLDRTVAIKVLPPHALTNVDDRARFYREAKAAAKLNHPNIAAVYEIDEAKPEGESEPRPFIAMEFIDGSTLEEKLKAGLFTLEEAVEMCSQVADALEAAHEKGVVHRDIKSANVMLSAKGKAKVLDFGLAKTSQSTMLTRMGSTLGTIAYMSPEQARGEEVDGRTDLWALGVMMYELITGKHPFPGDYEQAVVYGILNEDPAPMTSIRAGVPMSLDWIVGKLLAKKADKRYQTASDLLVDLKTADLTQAGLSRTTSHAKISVAQLGAANGSAASGAEANAGAGENSFVKYLPYALLVIGLVVGIGFSRILSPAQNPPQARHLQKSLDGIGQSRWPTISESGRYLALAGVRDNNSEPTLHIFDLEMNSSLSFPNSVRPAWPIFSHDETRIAFVSAGRLKIGNVAGGEPLDIGPASPETPTWGSDGSVYFLSSSLQIMVVTPSGQIEPLIAGDSTVTGLYLSSLTVDGRIMFVNKSHDDGKIETLALDMKTGKTTMILPAEGWLTRYVDSGHLIVQSGANGRLSAYPFDIEALEITGRAEPILPSVTNWNWFVTQSGHFTTYAGDQSVLLDMVELTGDGLIQSLLSDQMDFEEFQFSPSGNQIIAEINGYQNGVDQLLLFDLETGNSRQVTFDGQFFEPTFSPGGKRVAFSAARNGVQDIGEIHIDGAGKVVWLTDTDAVSGDPDWSPTGEFIAYDEANSETGFDIWIYSFSDSTSNKIIEEMGSQMYPRVSPNGRFIAYQSNQSRRNQVFVYDLETGTRQIITRDSGSRPVWGPGGNSLYFSAQNRLMVVDISTTGGFKVEGQVRIAYDVGAEFFFDISDNGRVAIARRRIDSSVLLDFVLNWSSTLDKSSNR